MIHTITFVPSNSADNPIEIQCSCGKKFSAKNGTDAMNLARTHREAEMFASRTTEQLINSATKQP